MSESNADYVALRERHQGTLLRSGWNLMPPLGQWIPYWYLVPPGGGCVAAPAPAVVARLVRRIENRDRAAKRLAQRAGDIMPRIV